MFSGFKQEKRFSLRTQSYRNVNCTTIARQHSQRKEKGGRKGGGKKKLARKPKVSFREMKIILNFRGTVCWSYFWCRITTHHSVVATTAEIYFAYFFQISFVFIRHNSCHETFNFYSFSNYDFDTLLCFRNRYLISLRYARSSHQRFSVSFFFFFFKFRRL